MEQILILVGVSTLQTLLMVFFSTLFAILIGFPLGVLLNTTNQYGITPRPVFNSILSRIIDVLRSFPFVILMIVLLPCTRLMLGTAYSAMAGTLGGGGLGDLAIRYGYQRFRTGVMTAAVIVIIIMVAAIQFAGTRLTNKMLSKR